MNPNEGCGCGVAMCDGSEAMCGYYADDMEAVA